MNNCQAQDCANPSTYTVKGYHLCTEHSLSDIRHSTPPPSHSKPLPTPTTEDDTTLPRFLAKLKRQELMQAAAEAKENTDPDSPPIRWTSLTNDEMIDYIIQHAEGVQQFMQNYNNNGGEPSLTPRQEQYLRSLLRKASKLGLDDQHNHPDPDNHPYTKREASQTIEDLKNLTDGKPRPNSGQGQGQGDTGQEQQGQGEGEQGEGEQGQGQGGQGGQDYVTHPELDAARAEDATAVARQLAERDDRIEANAEDTRTRLKEIRGELSDIRQQQQDNGGRMTIVVTPKEKNKPGERFDIDGHAKLPLVVTALEAGENVMLVGPAGTGKSTIAENAAQALGLTFYSISLGPTTPTSKMFGYLNATGDYVSTPFRRAWENGGLMLIDEYDNGHPGLNAEMNQAWAGTVCAFPDKMVTMHPDFRLVTTANTFGRGADRQYVGRNPLDAATLDRFITIEINVDEQLEYAIAHSLREDPLTEDDVTAWIIDVRRWRKAAEDARLNVIISPRAVFSGVKLMSAGFSRAEVIDAKITPGLTPKDVETLGVV